MRSTCSPSFGKISDTHLPHSPRCVNRKGDFMSGPMAPVKIGGASLAESMALWQRGEKLAEVCQGFLDGAREQVAASRKD